jgi:hypothetical protein
LNFEIALCQKTLAGNGNECNWIIIFISLLFRCKNVSLNIFGGTARGVGGGQAYAPVAPGRVRYWKATYQTENKDVKNAVLICHFIFCIYKINKLRNISDYEKRTFVKVI